MERGQHMVIGGNRDVDRPHRQIPNLEILF